MSDFDPEDPAERDIGREMVDQSTGLGSVAAHLYRGEVERAVTWRERMDTTTNWAVTVLSVIVAYSFTGEVSHAVILVGIVMGTTFMLIEARRFQSYDVWRSRVRMLQENLFANALDPSAGVEHDDWREALSHSYRDPEPKVSYRGAIGHRLRRVYLPLLGAMLFAWILHRWAFAPGETLLERAALPGIPGTVVIVAVTVYFLVLCALAGPLSPSLPTEAGVGDHGDIGGETG